LCSQIGSVAEVDKRRVAHRARGRRVRGSDAGSSSPARERREGERAPEAESSVAKPRDRWRVPTPSCCASGELGEGCCASGQPSRESGRESGTLSRERLRKRSFLRRDAKAPPLGALVEERRPEPGKSSPLTGWRWKRLWCSLASGRSSGSDGMRQRTSEVLRQL
jgi:hypothetical protein